MKYTRFSFFASRRLEKKNKYIAILMAVILFTMCLGRVEILAYGYDDNSDTTVTNINESNTDIEINIDDVVETGAANLGLTCKGCVLMEASTGSIIYEQSMDIKLSPASITKIMTLVLIFEALENGQIKLEDEVTTSAYAKSMGGSQVFLEEGEKQTVETLIKCIVVA